MFTPPLEGSRPPLEGSRPPLGKILDPPLRRLCFYTCLSVILFTGEVSASVHAGIHPTAGRHPPPGADIPPEQTPPAQCMLGDTGNKRAVRILLECILFDNLFSFVVDFVDVGSSSMKQEGSVITNNFLILNKFTGNKKISMWTKQTFRQPPFSLVNYIDWTEQPSKAVPLKNIFTAPSYRRKYRKAHGLTKECKQITILR